MSVEQNSHQHVLSQELIGYEPESLTHIADLLDSPEEQERLVGARLLSSLVMSQAVDRRASAAIADSIRFLDRDPLTGLLLRYAFERSVEDRIHEMGPEESRALIFIDLRHFGDINNEIGHLAGDDTLRAFAQGITESFRTSNNPNRGTDVVSIVKSDDKIVASRPGGDEYIVLVGDGKSITNETLGTITVNKMAELLLSNAVISVMEKYNIAEFGLKVGYCLISPGQSYDEMLAEADPKINTFKSLFVKKYKDKYTVCEEINRTDVVTLDDFYIKSDLVRGKYDMMGIPIAIKF